MINLLPETRKKDIRAARTSVILLRYMGILLLAFAFIFGVFTFSRLAIENDERRSKELISANDSTADVYANTKAEVDALSAGLTETKTILDQEIRYSKVLAAIAQQMPSGTVLESLQLDASAFSGESVEVKVFAKTNEDAVKLREQFQANPALSNVSFQTIDETGGISGYPVSVTLSFGLNRTVIR